jgi:hypothetical protein
LIKPPATPSRGAFSWTGTPEGIGCASASHQLGGLLPGIKVNTGATGPAEDY